MIQICAFNFASERQYNARFHWHSSIGLPGPSPSTSQPTTTPGQPTAQPFYLYTKI